MKEILVQLWTMSMKASMVILVVLLVRKMFQLTGVPKKFAYMLWAIPFIRLVVPWSYEWSFNIPLSHSEFIVYSAFGGVRSTSLIAQATISPVIVEQSPQRAVLETVTDILSQVTEKGQLSPDMENIVFMLCGFIWLFGVLALLVYHVVQYRKLKRRLEIAMLLQEGVYLADEIEIPFVLGIFRPYIYLPLRRRTSMPTPVHCLGFPEKDVSHS